MSTAISLQPISADVHIYSIYMSNIEIRVNHGFRELKSDTFYVASGS